MTVVRRRDGHETSVVVHPAIGCGKFDDVTIGYYGDDSETVNTINAEEAWETYRQLRQVLEAHFMKYKPRWVGLGDGS